MKRNSQDGGSADSSGNSSARNDAQSGQTDVRELIQDLFQGEQRGAHVTLSGLREHWAAVVGDSLARKTHPGRLDGNLLWIWAKDSAWAYQLQFFKDDLLQSISAFLESDEIRDLRFRLGSIPERPPMQSGPSNSEHQNRRPIATEVHDSGGPGPAPNSGHDVPADSISAESIAANNPADATEEPRMAASISDDRLKARFLRAYRRRPKPPSGH